MKVKSLLKAVRALKKVVVANGPQIATCAGLVLTVAACVKAVEKTPEAVRLIEEKKKEEHKEELTPAETVKATWKCYIWPVVLFVIAFALIIGGQKVSIRSTSAALAAYSLKEETLAEYKKAARTVVGERKENEIQIEAARNKVNTMPPLNTDAVISTGRGNALIYDTLSKKYFWSDPDAVRRAIETLNWRLRDEMYISLNDYWSEIGLPTTTPGSMLSWCVDNGPIDPSEQSIIVDDGPYKGYPCLVLDFYAGPEYNYNDRL